MDPSLKDSFTLAIATKTIAKNLNKGVFTLAQFHGRFRTKLAHLVMKRNFLIKMCKLNAKSRAKFANVNAPLGKSC